jgi:shikimate dehydrogenase
MPTFYFIGVTTAASSIMKVFPRWMQALGHPQVVIQGIDHPLHDHPNAYRTTVAQIKNDPLALGGLVTTHKIDLLDAAGDLFDCLDSSARLTGEVSCISKRLVGVERKGFPSQVELWGHAKDPLTSGLSMQAFLGEGYFGRTGGEFLCFGAGGSGKAMALHLINQPDPADRPKRFIVTNRSADRLQGMRKMIETLPTDIEFVYVHNSDPLLNDVLMASLPEHSVVVNATGMGKDSPGSPVSAAGLFPLNGIAWEINYRGELDFWHQAMAQKDSRSLQVEDGWLYFLHGWTQVIAEVLHIEIDEARFSVLADIAADLRPPLN